MKKIVSLGALSVLLCLTAMPAQAQHGAAPMKGTPGTELGRRDEFTYNLRSEAMFSDPETASAAYAIAASIARCMVGVSGDNAGDLIGGPNTSDENYRNLSRAMQRRYSACMKDASSMPPMVVNYGLAEALVLRDEDLKFADRAMSVNVDEAATFQGNAEGPATMDAIARCLTVYSPGLAHKVVQSNAASPEEGAALQVLYSQTPECGLAAPPATIPSVFQRGSLAVALYQWTHRAG